MHKDRDAIVRMERSLSGTVESLAAADLVSRIRKQYFCTKPSKLKAHEPLAKVCEIHQHNGTQLLSVVKLVIMAKRISLYE